MSYNGYGAGVHLYLCEGCGSPTATVPDELCQWCLAAEEEREEEVREWYGDRPEDFSERTAEERAKALGMEVGEW